MTTSPRTGCCTGHRCTIADSVPGWLRSRPGSPANARPWSSSTSPSRWRSSPGCAASPSSSSPCPGERTDSAHAAAYDLAQALLAPWPTAAHAGDWPAPWTEKAVVRGGVLPLRRPDPSVVAPADRRRVGSSSCGAAAGVTSTRRPSRPHAGHPGVDVDRAQPGPAVAATCGPSSADARRGRHPCRAERRRRGRGSRGLPPSSSPRTAHTASRRPPRWRCAGWVSRTGTTTWPAPEQWEGLLDAACRRRRRRLVTVELGARRPGRGRAARRPGVRAPSRRGRRGEPVTAPPVAVVTIVRGRHDHLAAQARRPATRRPVPRHLRRGRHRRPDVPRRGPRARPVHWDVRTPRTRLREGRMPLSAARNLGAATAIDARRRAPGLPRRRLRPRARRWSSATARSLATTRDAVGPGSRAGTSPTCPTSSAGTGCGPGTPAPPPSGTAAPATRTGSAWTEDVSAVLVAVLRRHRARLDAASGASRGLPGYGAEDTDFGQRLVRGGGTAALGGRRREPYHQHHPSASPPVQHLDDIVANANVFADRWGWWPMQTWLEQFRERGLVRRALDGHWQTLDLATEDPATRSPGASIGRGIPSRPTVGSSRSSTLRRNP